MYLTEPHVQTVTADKPIPAGSMYFTAANPQKCVQHANPNTIREHLRWFGVTAMFEAEAGEMVAESSIVGGDVCTNSTRRLN